MAIKCLENLGENFIQIDNEFHLEIAITVAAKREKFKEATYKFVEHFEFCNFNKDDFDPLVVSAALSVFCSRFGNRSFLELQPGR